MINNIYELAKFFNEGEYSDMEEDERYEMAIDISING